LSGKIDPDQMSPLFSDQLIKVATREQKMKSRHTGFTLIELVITIALLGILLAWAIPNITTFIKNARMSGAVNELIGDIGVARQEAQRRGRPVEICASTNGTSCDTGSPPEWVSGWIIWAPNSVGVRQIVKYNKEPSGPRKADQWFTGDGSNGSITFSPSGSATAGAIIKFRDDREGSADTTQRDISVTFVGRPFVQKVTG
jgi:type IV fimbrial biogenesis protein FimT